MTVGRATKRRNRPFEKPEAGNENCMENRESERLKVAILATDGVERAELMEPRTALENAGIDTVLVSPSIPELKTWQRGNWTESVRVDRELRTAGPSDFDALILPGGVQNPDRLRTDPQAVWFVRAFYESEKPIAAICHAPWMLVEADIVRGMRLTSWPSLRTDIVNAGGEWVDRVVVEDRWLVTSRKPEDLPAFNEAVLRLFKVPSEQRQAREGYAVR